MSLIFLVICFPPALQKKTLYKMCNTKPYYVSLNNLSSDSPADIYNNITDNLFF